MCGVALHLSSLRRTHKCASFQKIIRARCAPLSPTTWWRVPSFARLASGAFYEAVSLRGFYETIIVKIWSNQDLPSALPCGGNQCLWESFTLAMPA